MTRIKLRVIFLPDQDYIKMLNSLIGAISLRFEKVLWSIAFSALLLYILKYMDPEMLPAIILPIAAHEAGHIIALKVFGLKIVGLDLEPRGLCIRYTGLTSTAGSISAALAGPLSGMIYSITAAYLNRSMNCQWLKFSSDLSALYSIFNLMPIEPLDGGLILLYFCTAFLGPEKGEKLNASVSIAFSSVLLLIGVIITYEGKGKALFAAGLWLLISQSENRGIVKRKELL